MSGLDDVENTSDDQARLVDTGLDKAGDVADEKFGHEEQVDKAVETAETHTESKN